MGGRVFRRARCAMQAVWRVLTEANVGLLQHVFRQAEGFETLVLPPHVDVTQPPARFSSNGSQ